MRADIELFEYLNSRKRELLKLIIKRVNIVNHEKDKIYLLLEGPEYPKINILFNLEPESAEFTPSIWKISAIKK